VTPTVRHGSACGRVYAEASRLKPRAPTTGLLHWGNVSLQPGRTSRRGPTPPRPSRCRRHRRRSGAPLWAWSGPAATYRRGGRRRHRRRRLYASPTSTGVRPLAPLSVGGRRAVRPDMVVEDARRRPGSVVGSAGDQAVPGVSSRLFGVRTGVRTRESGSF